MPSSSSSSSAGARARGGLRLRVSPIAAKNSRTGRGEETLRLELSSSGSGGAGQTKQEKEKEKKNISLSFLDHVAGQLLVAGSDSGDVVTLLDPRNASVLRTFSVGPNTGIFEHLEAKKDAKKGGKRGKGSRGGGTLKGKGSGAEGGDGSSSSAAASAPEGGAELRDGGDGGGGAEGDSAVQARFRCISAAGDVLVARDGFFKRLNCVEDLQVAMSPADCIAAGVPVPVRYCGDALDGGAAESSADTAQAGGDAPAVGVSASASASDSSTDAPAGSKAEDGSDEDDGGEARSGVDDDDDADGSGSSSDDESYSDEFDDGEKSFPYEVDIPISHSQATSVMNTWDAPGNKDLLQIPEHQVDVDAVYKDLKAWLVETAVKAAAGKEKHFTTYVIRQKYDVLCPLLEALNSIDEEAVSCEFRDWVQGALEGLAHTAKAIGDKSFASQWLNNLSSERARLESFGRQWPRKAAEGAMPPNVLASAANLARFGFHFSTGSDGGGGYDSEEYYSSDYDDGNSDAADKARCFSCRFTYSDWSRSLSDPVQLHMEGQPGCEFVKRGATNVPLYCVAPFLPWKPVHSRRLTESASAASSTAAIAPKELGCDLLARVPRSDMIVSGASASGDVSLVLSNPFPEEIANFSAFAAERSFQPPKVGALTLRGIAGFPVLGRTYGLTPFYVAGDSSKPELFYPGSHWSEWCTVGVRVKLASALRFGSLLQQFDGLPTNTGIVVQPVDGGVAVLLDDSTRVIVVRPLELRRIAPKSVGEKAIFVRGAHKGQVGTVTSLSDDGKSLQIEVAGVDTSASASVVASFEPLGARMSSTDSAYVLTLVSHADSGRSWLNMYETSGRNVYTTVAAQNPRDRSTSRLLESLELPEGVTANSLAQWLPTKQHSASLAASQGVSAGSLVGRLFIACSDGVRAFHFRHEYGEEALVDGKPAVVADPSPADGAPSAESKDQTPVNSEEKPGKTPDKTSRKSKKSRFAPQLSDSSIILSADSRVVRVTVENLVHSERPRAKKEVDSPTFAVPASRDADPVVVCVSDQGTVSLFDALDGASCCEPVAVDTEKFDFAVIANDRLVAATAAGAVSVFGLERTADEETQTRHQLASEVPLPSIDRPLSTAALASLTELEVGSILATVYEAPGVENLSHTSTTSTWEWSEQDDLIDDAFSAAKGKIDSDLQRFEFVTEAPLSTGGDAMTWRNYPFDVEFRAEQILSRIDMKWDFECAASSAVGRYAASVHFPSSDGGWEHVIDHIPLASLLESPPGTALNDEKKVSQTSRAVSLQCERETRSLRLIVHEKLRDETIKARGSASSAAAPANSIEMEDASNDESFPGDTGSVDEGEDTEVTRSLMTLKLQFMGALSGGASQDERKVLMQSDAFHLHLIGTVCRNDAECPESLRRACLDLLWTVWSSGSDMSHAIIALGKSLSPIFEFNVVHAGPEVVRRLLRIALASIDHTSRGGVFAFDLIRAQSEMMPVVLQRSTCEAGLSAFLEIFSKACVKVMDRPSSQDSDTGLALRQALGAPLQGLTQVAKGIASALSAKEPAVTRAYSVLRSCYSLCDAVLEDAMFRETATKVLGDKQSPSEPDAAAASTPNSQEGVGEQPPKDLRIAPAKISQKGSACNVTQNKSDATTNFRFNSIHRQDNWAVIDLGSPKKVSDVFMFWYSDHGSSGAQIILDGWLVDDSEVNIEPLSVEKVAVTSNRDESVPNVAFRNLGDRLFRYLRFVVIPTSPNSHEAATLVLTIYGAAEEGSDGAAETNALAAARASFDRAQKDLVTLQRQLISNIASVRPTRQIGVYDPVSAVVNKSAIQKSYEDCWACHRKITALRIAAMGLGADLSDIPEPSTLDRNWRAGELLLSCWNSIFNALDAPKKSDDSSEAADASAPDAELAFVKRTLLDISQPDCQEIVKQLVVLGTPSAWSAAKQWLRHVGPEAWPAFSAEALLEYYGEALPIAFCAAQVFDTFVQSVGEGDSSQREVSIRHLFSAASKTSKAVGRATPWLLLMLSKILEKDASVSHGPLHPGAECRSCQREIRGVRYRCLNCVNFDLCAACESEPSKHRHDTRHVFVKISKPLPLSLSIDDSGSGHGGSHLEKATTHPILGHFLFKARKTDASASNAVVHAGVSCDDCGSQAISGVRWKCANCQEFNLCDRCESKGAVDEHFAQHVFVKLRQALPKEKGLPKSLVPHVLHRGLYPNCDKSAAVSHQVSSSTQVTNLASSAILAADEPDLDDDVVLVEKEKDLDLWAVSVGKLTEMFETAVVADSVEVSAICARVILQVFLRGQVSALAAIDSLFEPAAGSSEANPTLRVAAILAHAAASGSQFLQSVVASLYGAVFGPQSVLPPDAQTARIPAQASPLRLQQKLRRYEMCVMIADLLSSASQHSQSARLFYSELLLTLLNEDDDKSPTPSKKRTGKPTKSVLSPDDPELPAAGVGAPLKRALAMSAPSLTRKDFGAVEAIDIPAPVPTLPASFTKTLLRTAGSLPVETADHVRPWTLLVRVLSRLEVVGDDNLGPLVSIVRSAIRAPAVAQLLIFADHPETHIPASSSNQGAFGQAEPETEAQAAKRDTRRLLSVFASFTNKLLSHARTELHKRQDGGLVAELSRVLIDVSSDVLPASDGLQPKLFLDLCSSVGRFAQAEDKVVFEDVAGFRRLLNFSAEQLPDLPLSEIQTYLDESSADGKSSVDVATKSVPGSGTATSQAASSLAGTLSSASALKELAGSKEVNDSSFSGDSLMAAMPGCLALVQLLNGLCRRLPTSVRRECLSQDEFAKAFHRILRWAAQVGAFLGLQDADDSLSTPSVDAQTVALSSLERTVSPSLLALSRDGLTKVGLNQKIIDAIRNVHVECLSLLKFLSSDSIGAEVLLSLTLPDIAGTTQELMSSPGQGGKELSDDGRTHALAERVRSSLAACAVRWMTDPAIVKKVFVGDGHANALIQKLQSRGPAERVGIAHDSVPQTDSLADPGVGAFGAGALRDALVATKPSPPKPAFSPFGNQTEKVVPEDPDALVAQGRNRDLTPLFHVDGDWAFTNLTTVSSSNNSSTWSYTFAKNEDFVDIVLKTSAQFVPGQAASSLISAVGSSGNFGAGTTLSAEQIRAVDNAASLSASAVHVEEVLVTIMNNAYVQGGQSSIPSQVAVSTGLSVDRICSVLQPVPIVIPDEQQQNFQSAHTFKFKIDSVCRFVRLRCFTPAKESNRAIALQSISVRGSTMFDYRAPSPEAAESVQGASQDSTQPLSQLVLLAASCLHSDVCEALGSKIPPEDLVANLLSYLDSPSAECSACAQQVLLGKACVSDRFAELLVERLMDAEVAGSVLRVQLLARLLTLVPKMTDRVLSTILGQPSSRQFDSTRSSVLGALTVSLSSPGNAVEDSPELAKINASFIVSLFQGAFETLSRARKLEDSDGADSARELEAVVEAVARFLAALFRRNGSLIAHLDVSGATEEEERAATLLLGLIGPSSSESAKALLEMKRTKSLVEMLRASRGSPSGDGDDDALVNSLLFFANACHSATVRDFVGEHLYEYLLGPNDFSSAGLAFSASETVGSAALDVLRASTNLHKNNQDAVSTFMLKFLSACRSTGYKAVSMKKLLWGMTQIFSFEDEVALCCVPPMSSFQIPSTDLLWSRLAGEGAEPLLFDQDNCASSITVDEADPARASLSGQQGSWSVARSKTSFSSGFHRWDVVIGASMNKRHAMIMIGICDEHQQPQSHLGQDAHGWSYYGTNPGYAYHNSSNKSYGQPFSQDDVITVELDFDANTLSFSKNGTDLGVAFSGGIAGTEVYAAVTLLQNNDSVTFANYTTKRSGASGMSSGVSSGPLTRPGDGLLTAGATGYSVLSRLVHANRSSSDARIAASDDMKSLSQLLSSTPAVCVDTGLSAIDPRPFVSTMLRGYPIVSLPSHLPLAQVWPSIFEDGEESESDDGEYRRLRWLDNAGALVKDSTALSSLAVAGEMIELSYDYAPPLIDSKAGESSQQSATQGTSNNVLLRFATSALSGSRETGIEFLVDLLLEHQRTIVGTYGSESAGASVGPTAEEHVADTATLRWLIIFNRLVSLPGYSAAYFSTAGALQLLFDVMRGIAGSKSPDSDASAEVAANFAMLYAPLQGLCESAVSADAAAAGATLKLLAPSLLRSTDVLQHLVIELSQQADSDPRDSEAFAKAFSDEARVVPHAAALSAIKQASLEATGGGSGGGGKKLWAKGTGYGTSRDEEGESTWNLSDHMKKQDEKSRRLARTTKVVASVLDAMGRASSADALPYDEVVESTAEHRSILTCSGFLPALESYLKNDSLLDMGRHSDLYKNLLEVVLRLSLHPGLVEVVDKLPGQSSSIYELLSGLAKMSSTILKRINKAQSSNVDTEKSDQAAASSGKHEVEDDDESASDFEAEVGMAGDIAGDAEDGKSDAEAMKQQSDLAELIASTFAHVKDLVAAHRERKRAAKVKASAEARASGGKAEADSDDEGADLSRDWEAEYTEELAELQFDERSMLDSKRDDDSYDHHYRSRISSEGSVPAAKLNRLIQEVGTMSTNLPLHTGSSVFLRVDEDRIDVMQALITGPEDTPYMSGCFQFDIYCPEQYPKTSPVVNLQTTGHGTVRFNPNLYNCGKVCLSLLGTWEGGANEKWNEKTSTLLQVLVSIQSLIFVDEPYFNEPGYENEMGSATGRRHSQEYNDNIRLQTVRWAMVDQLKNPSPGFEDVVKAHFKLKGQKILADLNVWLREAQSSSSGSGHFSKLKKAVADFKAELVKLDPERFGGAGKKDKPAAAAEPDTPAPSE